MTAPDPRLDEIQARLSADWEASMSGGYIGDDQCMKDRDFLLAELRKAHEALERVEALHSHAHRDVEPWAIGYRFGGDHCSHDGQHWPCDTRAAVAAAKETE